MITLPLKMVSKFVIAGNTTQINFRYRCQAEFTAVTVDGDVHLFLPKTILRIDELGDDHVVLTYTEFPSRKKIALKIQQNFEHLDKLVGFSS